MKVVGLITEYNPFHKGHQYHIKRAKELTHSDYAVVIMSGDYVQRGEPAFLPKHLRTEMALKNGADAVFELPVCYATGSAELFAEGAITFLNQLNIVDSICFGSESDDLEGLQNIARTLCNEPADYQTSLQTELRKGNSFPLARQIAIAHCIGDESAALLSDPNNILGIEYLKAIQKHHCHFQPYTLKREGAHYHDSAISDSFSSASAIRQLLCSHKRLDDTVWNALFQSIPENCMQLFQKKYQQQFPVTLDDYSLLLKYRLLGMTVDDLITYSDVSQSLARRIVNKRNSFLQYAQFIETLKTKELTYSRISRALLHILLGLQQSDLQTYKEHGYHFYAKLLGFQDNASVLISELSKRSNLPIISRYHKYDELSDLGQHMYSQDIFASNLYQSVICDKYKTPFQDEFLHKLTKVHSPI